MSSDARQPTEPLIEPLSRREREILALLAEHHSAPEIAQRLTLAVSTVKWHLQQLYSKLGVNSKRQAIARARELGLLKLDPSAPHVLPSLPPIAQPEPPPVRHNLPLQLTSFIGREREVADIQRLIATARLVTLTGPGGTGKTRLALQTAAEMRDAFPDGTWLVELAPIAESELVPQTVARTLGVRTEMVGDFQAAPVDDSDRSAPSRIADHLRSKRLLLILDNCEHLVGVCAELSEELLRAAPGLNILATSREALGAGGEQNYPVPGLSLPEAINHLPLEAVTECDAVRLFVERAASVRPDFALTHENVPAMGRICQHLDGLPLAIELAAARVRALSVKQIATLLDEALGNTQGRFRLLTGGSRTAPPRQQTLRGAIDWSYALLTDDEQALLRTLSVFVGGWTLEAAMHVMDGPDVIEGLTQLVAKSLVLSTQPAGQEVRFRLLETICEYAKERLVESGEAESAHRRHLAYYLALAEAAEPELRGRGQVEWLKRLDREQDNLRAALAWAVRTGEADAALRLAGALTYFWMIRCNGVEGCRWLEAALDLPTSQESAGPSAWRAKALLGAGWLDKKRDLSASLIRLEKGLALYRELGDKSGIAFGLYLLGSHARCGQMDYATARRYYQEALALWTDAKDGWGIGVCLCSIGCTMEGMEDYARAREFYERSVEALRQAGDIWMLVGPLDALAKNYFSAGDIERSRALTKESLVAFEQLEITSTLNEALNWLAYTSILLGNYTEASITARDLQNRPKNRFSIAGGWVYLGQIEYLQGRPAEAQPHFEAAIKICQDLDDEFATWLATTWVQPWLASVAYRLGDLEQAKRLLHECIGNSPDQDHTEIRHALLVRGDVARVQGDVVSAGEYYARSLRVIIKGYMKWDVAARLESFAKLAITAQQPQRAARLFGGASALREQMSVPLPPIERADYDEAIALTRAQLDPAMFEAAWAEGSALSLEQAAAYALNEIEV